MPGQTKIMEFPFLVTLSLFILLLVKCVGSCTTAGLGSILDTVSEDTEDTAYLYLLNVS